MKIKNSLLDNATLAYYEVGVETEVIVDAISVGRGAMLTQKKRDSHRPVTYISRSLSPVEQRYSQTKREALAIRWACERLLQYRPGKDNPADYISRHPIHTPRNTTDYMEQKQTEEVVNSIVRRIVPGSLSVEEVRKATVNDPVLLEVIDIVQNGNGESRYTVKEDLGPLKLVRSELSVANGVLLRGSRIVVSKALQRRVVNVSHEGHQGIVKTKQLIRSAVWFPECKSDNGPPFQSRQFAEYAKAQGLRHRKTTPSHPEANGEAERFVRTLQKFITTTTVEGSSWRMSLPDFLRVYRSTPHTVTGRSPYSHLFGGREMRGKIPQFSLSTEEDHEVRQKDALKKGGMVTAERTTDGRMVTRSTKDFKSCPSPTKETTQATLSDKADDAFVAEKSPSRVDVAGQTSEMPQLTRVASSPHPPSAEEPRYPRRERHKHARFKDYVCG
ncbi:uncharacterized protein LOC141887198 [Acropora palmata]|uniref:uncharacterized protein LOC141887198 n=1 Tax=Acropora palmata TaxID=6131 RepID=UPI003DA1A263